MGMAASQARYLSITARMSNVEYQGQQINQERTVLSQQCTALYNSLLTIDVPTPPSSADYTKVVYKGTQGATAFTIGEIKPSGENYIVEFKTTTTGNALELDYGKRKVENNQGQTKIGGFNAYIFDADIEDPTLHPEFADYNLDSYKEAITNSFADKNPEDFYVYIDTSGTTDKLKFAMKEGVSSIDEGYTQTYSYIPNGTFTKSEQSDDCKLEFESGGRIKKVFKPIYQYDAKGNIVIDADGNRVILGYEELDVEATTVTDEDAYNDAMAQYQFAQLEYDKKQQDINAQTEVIQKEDKNLELKLTRLDNERKALDTERDAVKKVIEDNIDKSFKTFNG